MSKGILPGSSPFGHPLPSAPPSSSLAPASCCRLPGEVAVATQALGLPGPRQLERVGTHLADRSGHGAYRLPHKRRDPRMRRAAIAGTVKGDGRRKRLFGDSRAGHPVGRRSAGHCAVGRKTSCSHLDNHAPHILTDSKSRARSTGTGILRGQLAGVLQV